MADGKGFDFDPGHRVLITGGAGFVGSHLADALLAQGCHVHVIDNLSAGRRENLPASRDNFTFEEGDVGETYPAPGPLGAAVGKADFVFHLASPIGVMLAHSHRFEVTSRILREGLAVVEACAAHRKPLLFTSSSEVSVSSVISGASGFASLNSSVGVAPIILIASFTSVTPGKSTMSLYLSVAMAPPSSRSTVGSDTPNKFTRRSITSRKAPRESEIESCSRLLTSAR